MELRLKIQANLSKTDSSLLGELNLSISFEGQYFWKSGTKNYSFHSKSTKYDKIFLDNSLKKGYDFIFTFIQFIFVISAFKCYTMNHFI